MEGGASGKPAWNIPVYCYPKLALAAVIGAGVVVFSPVAGADPGSPSYNLGKKSIDDAVRENLANDVNGLQRYCPILLETLLKTGQVAQVDSASDFIAGCLDEGRAILHR